MVCHRDKTALKVDSIQRSRTEKAAHFPGLQDAVDERTRAALVENSRAMGFLARAIEVSFGKESAEVLPGLEARPFEDHSKMIGPNNSNV